MVVRLLAKEKVAGPNPVSRFLEGDFTRIPTNQTEVDWFFVFLPHSTAKIKERREVANHDILSLLKRRHSLFVSGLRWNFVKLTKSQDDILSESHN